MQPDGSLRVSPALAALIGEGFVAQVLTAEHRRAGVPVPPALAAFLAECAQVRRAQQVAQKSRRDGFPGSILPVSLVEGVSVQTFAEVSGTTVQNVRQRCRRGTLRAERDDRGRWWIDRQELPA